MIGSLLSDLMPWAIGAVAAIFGVLRYGSAKKKESREEIYMEALKARQDREDKARDAVSDLRGADRDDLAKRLRENDGNW